MKQSENPNFGCLCPLYVEFKKYKENEARDREETRNQESTWSDCWWRTSCCLASKSNADMETKNVSIFHRGGPTSHPLAVLLRLMMETLLSVPLFPSFLLKDDTIWLVRSFRPFDCNAMSRHNALGMFASGYVYSCNNLFDIVCVQGRPANEQSVGPVKGPNWWRQVCRVRNRIKVPKERKHFFLAPRKPVVECRLVWTIEILDERARSQCILHAETKALRGESRRSWGRSMYRAVPYHPVVELLVYCSALLSEMNTICRKSFRLHSVASISFASIMSQ